MACFKEDAAATFPKENLVTFGAQLDILPPIALKNQEGKGSKHTRGWLNASNYLVYTIWLQGVDETVFLKRPTWEYLSEPLGSSVVFI